MSLVKFATLCDQCGTRSEEYTSWPGCEGCGDEVCPACMDHLTREADYQKPELCICKHCASWPEIPVLKPITSRCVRLTAPEFTAKAKS